MSGEDAPINRLQELVDATWSDEQFHKEFYDFFPGIIYVYDAVNKRVLHVNKQITNLLGYSYEDLKSSDNDFSQVIFKDDWEVVQQELEKYNDLKDSDSYGYRCRFNKKAGDCLHFHVRGKILRRAENGKAASLLFFAQDISDQIKSDEESHALKDLITETEELLQFGTWTWERNTDKIKRSFGVYTILGYSKQEIEVAAKENKTITCADDAILRTSITQALENNQDFEIEYNITTVEGEEKIVYSKAKIIHNDANEIIKMIGITRCITEQTRLIKSLASYKQMMLEKEIFLGNGSWEMNYATNDLQWSDGMYTLFGYDPEVDKNNISIHQHFNLLPSEHVKKGKLLNENLTVGEKSYIYEFEIVTNQGAIRQLETFCKLITNERGNAIKLIGTTRDVTQIKNYERELEKKIIELKQSNKDLEDFAYIASHDIQEPLRKIISFSERLKNKYGEGLEDDAKKYLDRIMAATKNARQLIDGLMDFSRVNREDQIFEKTDLNNLIQEVTTELELKIEETETTILIDNLPTLEIIPEQIKRMFSNLLLNAIKFRSPSILPNIKIHSQKLSVAAIEIYHLPTTADYYLLTIEDNGIGFEEEYAEKIFEMFQRLHSKVEYPGAGIGLALCKKIVDNHRGRIFSKSKLNEGTTFSVILPETQH